MFPYFESPGGKVHSQYRLKAEIEFQIGVEVGLQLDLELVFCKGFHGGCGSEDCVQSFHLDLPIHENMVTLR